MKVRLMPNHFELQKTAANLSKQKKQGSSFVQKKILSVYRATFYEVYAVEVASEVGGAQFWILGPHFRKRVADGVLRPDILNASECEIVEHYIPPSWTVAINHYVNGTRTIFGPAGLIERGFLEALTNGDERAARVFCELTSALTGD